MCAIKEKVLYMCFTVTFLSYSAFCRASTPAKARASRQGCSLQFTSEEALLQYTATMVPSTLSSGNITRSVLPFPVLEPRLGRVGIAIYCKYVVCFFFAGSRLFWFSKAQDNETSETKTQLQIYQTTGQIWPDTTCSARTAQWTKQNFYRTLGECVHVLWLGRLG